MTSSRSRGIVAGFGLIALGLALYALRRYDADLKLVLVLVGGAFTVGYFWTRQYGFLIPGCILLGLGLGGFGRDVFSWTGSTQLGLGLGFVAIYLIQLLYEGRAPWWPLIPGSILVLSSVRAFEDLIELAFSNWPLLLVLAGVIVVVSSILRRESRPREP